MKKKITIISFLAVVFLISVSMVSAINTAEINNEKEESPLYNYRTNKAIQEKIQNIKTKFFGDRLFFLPFQWLRDNNLNLRDRLQEKDTSSDFTCEQFTNNCATCAGPYCGPTKDGSPTCYSPTCTNTCQPTILCGHCTQGIICKTLNDNCWQ